MYAIIRQGGKQYRISAGDEIVCDKVKGNQGEAIRFDKVLLVSDGEKTIVMPDELAKYDVKAELIENFADNKVLVFKYKAKKGYRQTNGHRQQKSLIKIMSIGSAKAVTKKAPAVKEPEAPVKAELKKAPAGKAKAAKPEAKPKKPAAGKTSSKKTEATG